MPKPVYQGGQIAETLRRIERRNVLLDDLLNLALNLRSDVAGSDLSEKTSLSRSQVSAELSLPRGDLVNGDGVEQTVDTGIDDRHLNLHSQWLVLTLLCNEQLASSIRNTVR